MDTDTPIGLDTDLSAVGGYLSIEKFQIRLVAKVDRSISLSFILVEYFKTPFPAWGDHRHDIMGREIERLIADNFCDDQLWRCDVHPLCLQYNISHQFVFSLTILGSVLLLHDDPSDHFLIVFISLTELVTKLISHCKFLRPNWKQFNCICTVLINWCFHFNVQGSDFVLCK